MKTYAGRREGHVVSVTVNTRPLNPRLDLWNHSPTGFEWGYDGSGPAQLALAILVDHLNDVEAAFKLYHQFKQAVIAKLPGRSWTLTSREIDRALTHIRTHEATS